MKEELIKTIIINTNNYEIWQQGSWLILSEEKREIERVELFGENL